jgi:hypothetical protein
MSVWIPLLLAERRSNLVVRTAKQEITPTRLRRFARNDSLCSPQ